MTTNQETIRPGHNLNTWRNLGVALSKTEGSDHYFQKVQPIELIASNGQLEGFCIGSIIKYASRYKNTQNKKDLIKIADYAQILLGYKTMEEEILDVDHA